MQVMMWIRNFLLSSEIKFSFSHASLSTLPSVSHGSLLVSVSKLFVGVATTEKPEAYTPALHYHSSSFEQLLLKQSLPNHYINNQRQHPGQISISTCHLRFFCTNSLSPYTSVSCVRAGLLSFHQPSFHYHCLLYSLLKPSAILLVHHSLSQFLPACSLCDAILNNIPHLISYWFTYSLLTEMLTPLTELLTITVAGSKGTVHLNSETAAIVECQTMTSALKEGRSQIVGQVV